MGVSFSCPLSTYSDLDNNLESVIVKSISFGDNELRTPVRSVSFKGQDSEPTIFQSLGSGKMMMEQVVSFTTSDNFALFCDNSYKAPCEDKFSQSVTLCGETKTNPKHNAALKLQKVYKSFRTRRKLADSAVLIEQSWWKLLDFAELKHSSISFFEIEKHETAISRWSRAKNRAAKVGKGLSKNEKAQKLALQHWLEAIDPRHRYGHNLQFYYVKWLDSESNEPFFYWLDLGEGKEVNLVDKCPRWKLQDQCIKYLGPMERKAYEVLVEDGKLLYKQSGELLNTDDLDGAKWIFVLSTSKALYVGKKTKGKFQHSSFLAGGATLAAGRIVVQDGILKAVWPHSGHYRPTPENFQDFISFLGEYSVDVSDVKFDCVDEEESGVYPRSNSSENDLPGKGNDTKDTGASGIIESKENENVSPLPLLKSRLYLNFSGKLANLEIPRNDDFLERLKSEVEVSSLPVEQLNNANSCGEVETDKCEEEEEGITEESILERINSHNKAKSYQLGEQLSCRWSSGAGPRIGCLRDYPSQLQSHALGQVSLSPRSTWRLRLNSSPSRAYTPPMSLSRLTLMPCSLSPLPKMDLSQIMSLHSRWPSSPSCKGIAVI
ncbi:PREDICTED: IQ domain-containing protein IQM2-like [Ipomoea nil]|uniref:IQ domain-containing protein IQM2-like n=1 Tax=Ipomoea nil TaxID=35883 RepID=UPI000901FACF|nr:PREDICTED: IQ domain-containing protein IQM2-like [Ipomoea nil]